MSPLSPCRSVCPGRLAPFTLPGLAALVLWCVTACNVHVQESGAGGGPGAAPPGRFEAVGTDLAADRLAPVRVARAADGTVFVSEPTLGRVTGLRDGVPVLRLVDLARPLGVAVSGDLLFVGQSARGSVDAFSLSTRRYVRSLGQGAGEVSMPNDLAVRPDGQLVVVDSQADIVSIYDQDGQRTGVIGGPGTAPGQFRFPAAVAVDPSDGTIAVADQSNHRVQLFDREGRLTGVAGAPLPMNATGEADLAGRFTRVQAVALEPGRLHVLDAYHAHVQTFARDGGVPGPSLGFTGRRGACAECLGLSLGLAMAGPGQVLATDPDRARVVTLNVTTEGAP